MIKETELGFGATCSKSLNTLHAQDGVGANLSIFQHLLTRGRQCHNQKLQLQCHDSVQILDLNPYNADRTIAATTMITQGSFKRMRTLVANIADKTGHRWAEFTKAFVYGSNNFFIRCVVIMVCLLFLMLQHNALGYERSVAV
jgi:hypothetical protein